MTVDASRNPALSVYELVLLFDDKPTVALVAAICEQTLPSTNRQLLFAMYGVPVHGALPHSFDGRTTDEQARVLQLGFDLWRKEPK